MSLSYDWSILATVLADLKVLVGLDAGKRLSDLEARPLATPYDDSAVTTRLTTVEAQIAGNGTDDASVLLRVVALEAAISALSTQLAGYAPAPVPEVPAPEPEVPPVEPEVPIA